MPILQLKGFRTPTAKSQRIAPFFPSPQSLRAAFKDQKNTYNRSVPPPPMEPSQARCLMRVKPGVTVVSVILSKEIRLKRVSGLNEAEESDWINRSDPALWLSVWDVIHLNL